MIEITSTRVWGFEAAMRGMRQPFKTTDKGDSEWVEYKVYGMDDIKFPKTKAELNYHYNDPYFDYENDWDYGNDYTINEFMIGEKDMDLAMKLVKAGPDHGKLLRYCHVQADAKAPLFWWKEYDTYKISTVANSESTMHTITKYPFGEENFSLDGTGSERTSTCMMDVIDELNFLRSRYLYFTEKGMTEKAHEDWRSIILLLPESYMQTRTIDLNYQTLRTIYFARRNHKLSEWHQFCEWIESLPYSELITGKVPEDDNL